MNKIFFALVCFLLSSYLVFPIGDQIKKDINPAYSFYLKGLSLEHFEDYNAALEEYQKALSFDSKSGYLQLKIAIQYIKIKKYDKAISILKVLKDRTPVDVDAYLLLMLLYSEQGKSSDSDKVYEEMLSSLYAENPGNIKVAVSLANLKWKNGDISKAVEVYKKALVVYPEAVELRFWLGYIYDEAGRRKEAVSQWKKILEISPDNAEAMNALGYTYAEEGLNLTKAEALIKKALEIKPDSPAYLDSLGWVYFKKKDFHRAEEYIKKAVSFMRDPEILEHLGDVYYQLGEKDKAEKVWQEALDKKPDNKEIKEKLGRIKNATSGKKD